MAETLLMAVVLVLGVGVCLSIVCYKKKRRRSNAVQSESEAMPWQCDNDRDFLSSMTRVVEPCSTFTSCPQPHNAVLCELEERNGVIEKRAPHEEVDCRSGIDSAHFQLLSEDISSDTEQTAGDCHVNKSSPLHDKLYSFVNDTIIPCFNGQRASKHQFAVLLLLTESDLHNITSITFDPSDNCGQPILNNDYPSMPRDASKYGNYIVARPIDITQHSEEEIFGKTDTSGSPFSQLWCTYVSRHRTFPRCVLLYSWNLPCRHCTDVIIRVFEESPFDQTKLILVHSKYWKSESDSEHRMCRDKLTNRNIIVERVTCPTTITPCSVADHNLHCQC